MKPAKASSPKQQTLTEEQSWGMELESVSTETLAGYRIGAFESAEERERAPQLRSRWTSLLQGEPGKAMEEVYGARGEHVVGNAVSRYGVCRLKVMRLGRAVEWRMYAEQVTARVGVHGLRVWAWLDGSNGQEMHVALLVWKQE